MAWRIGDNLIDGTLDNTRKGRVTGTLHFLGMDEPVDFNVEGDFKGELKGKRIRLHNPEPRERNERLGKPGTYMEIFRPHQTGWSLEGVALREGQLHISYHSEQNKRVVMELPEAAWSLTELP